MIAAATWFCGEHCGAIVPNGRSWQQPSPPFSATEQVLALVGRPVKYYSRMTAASRSSLLAASFAQKAMHWTNGRERAIGLVCAGDEGCIAANEAYFRDYVASGRTMGRGNLFIYTLPTSALGEVAIALSLVGPSLYLQDDANPLASLVRQAEQLVLDGEAEGVLAIYEDAHAAICLAIEAGQQNGSGDEFSFLRDKAQSTPLELARRFGAMTRPT